MVLQVDDFKEAKLSTEDFEQQPSKRANLNRRTAAQLAAGQTVLAGGTPEEYNAIKDELLDPEQREKFLLRHEQVRQSIFDDAQEGLVSLLADPSVDDETKTRVIKDREGGLNPEIKTPSLQVIAEESLVADSDAEETARSAEGRNLMLETHNKVIAHKRKMTELINGLNIDQSTAGVIADVAETLVPFAEWVHYQELLREVKGEDDPGLLGTSKDKLFTHFKGMSLDDRAAAAEAVIELVKNSDTVVLPDGNDLVTLESLENMLVENDYSNFEKWFDNVTSVLEAVGGLGTAIKGVKTSIAGARAADAVANSNKMREARTAVVRSDTVPTSPSQIVKDTNPKMSRDMHKMVEEDDTGEVAEALYGTTREEALGKDILHEPEALEGEVPNKVEMTQGRGLEPDAVKKIRSKDGNTIVSDREIGVIREKISEGLKEIEGMVMHPASMVVRANPDASTSFTARYSPLDSGFTTPQEALDSAEVAFRNYGLSPENFTILARRGDKWVEADIKDLNAEIALKEAGAEGLDAVDYAIGMKYDYKFKPDDLNLLEGEFDNLTTAPGLISRTVQMADRLDTQILARTGQGSLVQNLLDAASVIHPQIVNAASVAVDRAFGIKKVYVEQFEGFTKGYKNLPKERRAMMSDYIHQANLEGLKLDVADLAARGFNESEIGLLKDWRRANDTMWHGANEDMVKTLRSKGVKVFSHKGSDTTLMGRTVARPSASAGDYFDPATNSVVRKSKEDLDLLYENKGEVVELTEPLEIDGKVIKKVVSANTPEGGFVRPIRDGESVLAYRDGYYPVMYDANHFVYKKVRDSEGNIHNRVFAAAKTRKEVDEILEGVRRSEKLNKEELAEKYGHRPDRRISSPDNSLFDEGAWNVSANSGLSSQRLRGKRLEEAGADLQGLGKAHLKDPLEAVATQVQHLSQRLAMRDYMDSAKKRWMLQFEEHLDIPISTKTGKKEMPRSVAEIKGKPGANSKIVADARTNYNYIAGLENGYINGMDKAYRATMQVVANQMADWGWSFGEQASFAMMNKSPTQAAKTAAFKFFIAGNPARQAVIQRGQIMLVTAHNPTYSLSKMLPDLAGIDMVKSGLSKNPKYVKLFEEVKDSGLLEAVDAHTLIRDDLLQMADMGYRKGVMNALGAPLRVAQKYGFDAAEQDVLLSAWLSARDKALKAGKNITDQRVKDQILGEARAFTLNMNRSGEMPYGQNTLSAVTQFLSFQHKALMQPLTNRSLSVKDRAKMMGYTAAVFGVDATVLGLTVDAIFGEEPSEVKDTVKNGLLDVALNRSLSLISGEAQAIDFGDLAPTEAYTMGQTFFSLLDTPFSELLVTSPSGSLLFGNNPRVSDAFATGFKWFVPGQNYDDPELAVNYKDVAHAAMSLFSGYSNTFKANYAYHMEQKMSGSGRITDDDVTSLEAVATVFGFRTKEEEGSRKLKEHIYSDMSYTADDVDEWYNELKRHLGRRYTNVAEHDMAQRVLSEAWEVFGEDRPKVLQRIASKMERDAKVGDFDIVKGIINDMGLSTEEDLWKTINAMPAGPERDALTDLMNYREDIKDGS